MGFHIIETTHELAETVDSTLVVTGSQQEAMVALTREDIGRHEIGLYVVPILLSRPPAFGYIACKELFTPEAQSQTYALIGGLYLHHAIRGQGIAQGLVELVTDFVFERYSEVAGCAALCNNQSQKAFALADYQPLGKSQSLLPTKEDKVPLLAQRERWQWYKKYQNATIGDKYGCN